MEQVEDWTKSKHKFRVWNANSSSLVRTM